MTKLPAPSGFKAPLVVAVGLGAQPEKDSGYDTEALRKAAGVAARTLAGAKKARVRPAADGRRRAGAVAEGVLLGAYSFDAYKDTARDGKERQGCRSPRPCCSAANPATRRTRPRSSAPPPSPRS
ncbi:hypothetical protein GCM10023238_25760 [Streptomyces heliomycini]